MPTTIETIIYAVFMIGGGIGGFFLFLKLFKNEIKKNKTNPAAFPLYRLMNFASCVAGVLVGILLATLLVEGLIKGGL